MTYEEMLASTHAVGPLSASLSGGYASCMLLLGGSPRTVGQTFPKGNAKRLKGFEMLYDTLWRKVAARPTVVPLGQRALIDLAVVADWHALRDVREGHVVRFWMDEETFFDIIYPDPPNTLTADLQTFNESVVRLGLCS